MQTFWQETLINAAAVVLDNPHRSDRSRYCSEAVWRDTRAFMLFALARHGRVLESEINRTESRCLNPASVRLISLSNTRPRRARANSVKARVSRHTASEQ